MQDEPELLYGATTEDEGKGYAATTLPFQAYGALGEDSMWLLSIRFFECNYFYHDII